MGDGLGERVEELASAVLAPLVLGGKLSPVRPFGGKLGLRIGVGRSIQDNDLRLRIDVARVRAARLLAPLDALPAIDEAEWAALAAYNDLIQLTNHHLGGILTRGRYARLAQNLAWLCERIPAPRDPLSALARHATFGRALDAYRTDSSIAWWTGSARFRGEPPPRRLTAWRELRRVRVDADKVSLADMVRGSSGITERDYQDLLALWLTRSPLTDLATAGRASPAFAWSQSTLSLTAVPLGQRLASRAILRSADPDRAIEAITEASRAIPAGYDEARAIAATFVAMITPPS